MISGKESGTFDVLNSVKHFLESMMISENESGSFYVLNSVRKNFSAYNDF